jgi:glycosyltransferase involved in cell wall biosynthesis
MPMGRIMKELWLFTINFPYGSAENSLEHELEVVAPHFRRVLVFPLFPLDGKRDVPANVEVRDVLKDPYHAASLWTVVRHWRSWRALWKVVFESAPDPAVARRQRRVVISKMRQALARTLAFRDRMGNDYDPEKVVLYSSWTMDWATILGLWKGLDPRVRFVTRMRGFDLYEHRAEQGWQVFRAFHLEKVHHVFLTCAAARDHLVSQYPQMASRSSIAPTATDDHGPGPWSPSSSLRIVSCANLIPLKRVHLLAEALAGMERRVEWVHFGDGSERERIIALAGQGAHLRLHLKGRLSNREVMEWYRTNPVDLFVHTSSSEGGIAVALQEAASFGIPLMACATGGVGEIVNGTTGILLPQEVSAQELRDRIEEYATGPADLEQRKRIRAFWAAHFHAPVVHARFAQMLCSI